MIRPFRAAMAAQTSSHTLKIKLNFDENNDVFKNLYFMSQAALNVKLIIWTSHTLPYHATIGIFLLTTE